MNDIKCKECIKLFDSDIQIIRLNDNRFMSVECFSISFEGHIQLEGTIIGFVDDEGNIRTLQTEEEIKILVCNYENSINNLNKFFEYLSIKY